MDKIPICPHCGGKVTEVKEVRTATHRLELGLMRYMIKSTIKNPDGRDYHVWGNKWVESDRVFDKEGYRAGEYTFIVENDELTYTCAKCGGNLNGHFDVMGAGGWMENPSSIPLQRTEVKQT